MIRLIPLSLALACTCVAPALAQGDVPPGTVYMCDEGSLDRPTIQVVIPHTPGQNATLMLDSEALEMAPTPVGSGFGYDIALPIGHFLVRGKGSDVELSFDGQAPVMCQATADSHNTVVSAMGNFSLGGNVRAGPGTDFARTDSLPYGEPVAILARSGVMFDGYEWFEIEYSEGLRGYQWGGIMCSNALHIIGLYEECPADLN
ncbi:SH3 domain-containing protein [Roseibaca sp. Y0-43]|uniref:SH3 domain-containing protein n=1 Tax=Roseibaca sp. Y0-43 TaxID=2816854 RepID=UPI001D0CC18E|nr:SH3 domain-containing protein [Roseibaca sp. Y0-43]MCC1482569.1 SH3 domain-containing protein [Roseibaca sp. Y0-43]